MRVSTWGLAGFTFSLLLSIGCSESNGISNTPVADGACSDSTGNRFVDCGNGTVTDTATGLIWLKNANCFGAQDWNAAHFLSVPGLKDGVCGLSDHSSAGDWRLPTLECPSPSSCPMTTPPTGEFATIFRTTCAAGTPHVVNTAGTGCWTEGNPFSGVQPFSYWSSTTDANLSTAAWVANLPGGTVYSDLKGINYHVWAVRGP